MSGLRIGDLIGLYAWLEVLVAKKVICKQKAEDGKTTLVEIVSMLAGLIRANSDTREY